MIIVSKKDVTTEYSKLEDKSKEQIKNAIYIYQILSSDGWSLLSIAAVLGNMCQESNICPGLHENGGSGFGLCQWTPKTKFTEWLNSETGKKLRINNKEDDIDNQLICVIWEKDNGEQWIKNRQNNGHDISFKDFIKTTDKPLDWMVEAWCWNYEWPDKATANLDRRNEMAKFYYEYILTNCVFEPRLSENKPTSIKNKYYTKPGYKGPDDNKNGVNICISGSPEKWTGSVLSNCIGYAWGRIYEITNKSCKLTSSGPDGWFVKQDGTSWTVNDAKKKDAVLPTCKEYKVGIEPKLGAIACWRGQHAAVVEEINKKNKTFTTSNSAYNGQMFYTDSFSINKSGNYNYYNGRGELREFLGFIYVIDFNLSDYEDEIDYAPMIENVTQESNNDLNCIVWENKDTITITGYVNGKEDITKGLSVYVSWDTEIPSITKYDINKEIKLEKNKDGKWVAING